VATDLRERLQSTLGSAYTLERELGGGGMSRVFVADETTFGRKVVVKGLPPDLAAGVSVDRFKREIQVAARLQHPHIVPVLSAGERYTGDPAEPVRMWDIDWLHFAGAHKRLGELYEAKGQREKAASHYAKFVDLWRDADPQLQPHVRAASERLRNLQRAERP